MPRTEPPDWAERLVARAFRRDPSRDAVLGDLREEMAEVCRTRGRRTARRWYVREALLLAGSRLVLHPLHALQGTTDMPASTSNSLRNDAAYAWRSVRRSPGFALFGALIVGLGVGATTAVFSVLRPFLLAPLPFEDAERLVWISNDPGDSGNESLSAYTSRSGNLRDFRREARSFEGIAGYNAFFAQASPTLAGEGPPERLTGVDVTGDFLGVLGVTPALGRDFTEEEGLQDGPPAIILSHGFWVRRFGSDPGVVGRALVLDGEPREVVGVLPASFDFSAIFTPRVSVDFLEPWPVSDQTDQWGNSLFFIGRLRPGVSPEAAQAELDAVVAALREAQPDRWGLGAIVTPLRQHFSQPFSAAFGLLAAAAATVLLIVSVNLSNLLLARSPGRAREVAVRKAFGASRARMVRQMVFESVLVAGAGALVGAALARVVVGAASGAAVTIPFLDRMEVDGVALAFGSAVALLTGVVVGLVPALRVADGAEAEVLRAGGRGSGVGRGARRLREVLVVGEVALACSLLVVGGLLLRSFQAVTEVDLGFEPDGAAVWRVKPSDGFDSRAAMAEHYGMLADAVRELPGVTSVGLIDRFPMGQNRTWGARIVGEDGTTEEGIGMYPNMVDGGWFEAMGIRLVEGRAIDRDDRFDSEFVVVLNETAARTFFADADALGRQLRVNGDLWTVVGIAEDIRHAGPDQAVGSQVYFPLPQLWSFSAVDMVVRGDRPLEQLVPGVAGELAAIDPVMPTRDYWTVESRVSDAVSPRRFTLAILAGYGAVALLLAGLGIYGVLAQSVAERRAELGIRMALGASAGEILRSVMARTLALAGIGIVVGGGLALVGGELLRALLFQVEPTDPAAYAGMATVLLAVAAAAAALPAIQATRARGMRALRSE